MCRVISLVLKNSGYDVTSEFDGESAWAAAQRETFDLVITDQQMPRLLGSELCQRLRATDQYNSTPMFMLTAKGMELDLTALQAELGIEKVFAKPFSPAEIVSAVEQQLSAAT